MKDLIIVGAGGHARPVIEAAQSQKKIHRILGVLDSNLMDENESILGVPVLGDISLLDKFNSKEVDVFIAIGDNQSRRMLFQQIKSLGFNLPNIIHSNANVCSSARIGCGNFIGIYASVGPLAKVGNGCIINSYVNIEHEVALGEFCQLAPNSVVCGRTQISSDVFVGASAVIIDHLSISPGVIIGAGSVVLKNIELPGSKYVGTGRYIK